MGLLEQLQDQGWYITQSGLEKLLEGEKNGNAASADVKQVVKLALNADLREYGSGAFSSLASRGTKAESFDGPGVVQLVKLRNLSAPKVNEESKTAPRLLKLTLTDGQTQYIALEHEHIPALTLNTPPGTKLLLKNGPIRILQGVMMLSDKNVQVLGGHVTALVEKWELSRTMAKYAKGGRLQFSASGPPPWIPFGQKIQQPVVNSDKDFKSLQTKEKEESTENTAFNALRNDAIAEATKLGTKKTFGGGAKQMVDANVQKIMDKGFTEEQATHALKLTRNNVHRALSNLQRIEDRKQAQADAGPGGAPSGGKGDGHKSDGRRGFGKRDSDLELQSKPSGKVSLFEYFGDILQDSESTTAGGKKSSKESTPNDKEHNRARSDSTGGRQTNNNRHNAAQNQSSSTAGGTNRSQTDANQNPAGGMVNGSNSKNYNSRFENNISSSFANRSTSSSVPSGGGSGRGDRGRGDQHQGQGQQRDQHGNYKQSDYYGSGSNSRYRGGNETHSSGANQASGANASGTSGARGGGSSRGNDSKYNQQHQSGGGSGYGHNSQQQRQDGYNNNNGNAGGGGKYGTTGGKGGQSNNSTSGYGNNYGSEGRNNANQQSQFGHGSATNETRSSASGKSQTSSNHHQAASQQQSSYGSTPKQSGYNNQQQSSGSSHNAANGGNNSNGPYNQQAGGGNHGNNYGSGNATKNSNKGGRYGGKDESHKYAGVSASQSATTAPQQNKKGSSKTHGSQHNAQGNASDQQPFHGTSVGGKQGTQHANASGKVNQVADQLGTMQISGAGRSASQGASNNNGNSTVNASGSSTTGKSGPMKQMNPNIYPPTGGQQHAPQIASPPGVPMPVSSPAAGGPSPGAPLTPSPGVGAGANAPASMAKTYIQLPNGYNYNPYQIMGFQNKQTNEFALNVLKSQQQFDPMHQPPHLGPPGPSAVPATVSPVGVNAVPVVPNVASPGVLQQAPPPPTASLAITPTAGMPTVFPNWKIGDRCLAKYWEDGGFYAAEITNTSKNTFVVHFLEYGNYEEVLKTDCIPITQAAAPAAPAPLTLNYHAAPATSHMPPPPQPPPSHPPAAPVQFAPHPGHPGPHHPMQQHHPGHVPTHHPPPLTGAPGPFQPPMPEVDHNNPHSHYGPFKGGPMQMQPPPGQGPLPPAMNQFQPTQQHHHSQQQHPPQGGHMAQHHHQSQMAPHGQQRGGGGKFREQRPMYVPPAQRK